MPAVSSLEGLQKTSLFPLHREAGAHFTAFAGWAMPLYYSSILAEHRAVRTHVGIFDVSHMGQIRMQGQGARDWLNRILPRDLSSLAPGKAVYTFLLSETGGILDDLILYCLAEEEFLAVVNASQREQDLQWLKERGEQGVLIEDQTQDRAILAVQGPSFLQVAKRALGEGVPLPGRFGIAPWGLREEGRWVARTGYTGEDGIEILLPACQAPLYFELLLGAARQFGGLPCGLGARDSLRIEAGLPLVGQELTPERTPLEAGLEVGVSLGKREAFPGKEALLELKKQGPRVRLVTFQSPAGSPLPRPHAEVFVGHSPVGQVTSATFSPMFQCPVGLAYLEAPWARTGTLAEIKVREKRVPAQIFLGSLLRRLKDVGEGPSRSALHPNP
jgi:aminomethyltransferase